MRVLGRSVVLVVVTAVVVPLLAAGTVLAALVFLPLPASLPPAKPGVEALVSRIYDINGNEMGVFRQFDSSKPVRRGDIPEVLKQAVIASEDRRFYQHSGVDLRGTARALWADIRNQEVVQGGSTITQQYVKGAYVGGERSLSRKVREAVLASQLDRQVDKDEILFRYLERIYLGEGAYGVGAAAETYFRKAVSDLNLSEAALLAGLIPAPSRYEPRGDPAQAEERRLLVLDAMLGEGMITPEEHAEAAAQPVWLAAAGATPPEGGATVVHPREQAETAYPYFVDYLQRYLSDRYGEDAVYQRGLRIYTTLDPRMQAEAERSVAETLSGTEPPLEMSLVSVEPLTGFVKALVGGRDFASSRVNLALGPAGGGSGRQPGSAFKPFVLAQAFEEGIAPTRSYSGASPMVVGDKSFSNFGGSSYGRVDLRTATRQSINTAYVQLLQDVGVPETMDLARRMGVSTSNYQEGVHGLSIALGSLDVAPIDMASSFGVFAARGSGPSPRRWSVSSTPRARCWRTTPRPSAPGSSRRSAPTTSTRSSRACSKPEAPPVTTGSTARRRARPAPPRTTATPGSWVTPRRCRRRCGWATPTPPPPRGHQGGPGGHRREPARGDLGVLHAGALADVPVTDFTEPAPITDLADILRRRSRGGFDVRSLKEAEGTSPGVYVEELPAPAVEAPTATTAPTTTTTVQRRDDDDPGSLFERRFPGQRRDDDDDRDRDRTREAGPNPPGSD